MPTKCIRRYIPKTIEIVPLHPNTVEGVHYVRVHQQNVSVGIFQRPWKLFPFTLTLFIVFITYGYTNEMCLSVYSRDHENCAPSPWHYSQCSLHTCISTKYVHRYILETMRTVAFHPDTIHGVYYIQVYR
jgi:hypothetical protein